MKDLDDVTGLNGKVASEGTDDVIIAKSSDLDVDSSHHHHQSGDNTCGYCGEVLKDSEQHVFAIGNTYHVNHFKCGFCDKSLAGETFYARDSKPCCEECFSQQQFLPSCAFCGEEIQGKCISAIEKHWHPNHFFCAQCGKIFGPDELFMENDGKAYCETDYMNMFAPQCNTCGNPIVDEVVSAFGKSFHSSCFVCTYPSCETHLIEAGNFFDHQGKPYCEYHYHMERGSLCLECDKPIVGKCISASGKRYHPEHFKCSFCKKSLCNVNGSSGVYKEHASKPYCVSCHNKLF